MKVLTMTEQWCMYVCMYVCMYACMYQLYKICPVYDGAIVRQNLQGNQAIYKIAHFVVLESGKKQLRNP